ncbi:histidine phosphatase family protein [Pleurocapsales cyanobacterium LEGE 06147]|nr:histidine phosphatase family protein [Pleurocapsales cyanobacterium LEGE 06147]
MSLKVYFLRHGETTSSQTGTYCGALDINLTPEGHQMAKDFAQAYQSLPWTAIYTSPLRRTVDTAKPLCQAVGIEMQSRDGLKEITYGKWEGKTPEEINHEFHDEYVRWLADPGWNSPTGGEKGVDIARRSSLVLEEIEQTHSTGNVLVVSHKATIRIMLCSLLGIDVGRFRDRIGMPVASVTIVEMAERGPLLHVMGDRSHLSEQLRQRVGT